MGEKKGYVKLWLSYETYFGAYTPEQVGNLTLAMLAYKNDGTEPEFYGPERFICRSAGPPPWRRPPRRPPRNSTGPAAGWADANGRTPPRKTKLVPAKPICPHGQRTRT